LRVFRRRWRCREIAWSWWSRSFSDHRGRVGCLRSLHCHLGPSLLQGYLLWMPPHLTRHTWAWARATTHWPRLSSHDICSQLINVNVPKTDIGSPLTTRHHLAWLLLLLLSLFLLQQVLDEEWLLLLLSRIRRWRSARRILWVSTRAVWGRFCCFTICLLSWLCPVFLLFFSLQVIQNICFIGVIAIQGISELQYVKVVSKISQEIIVIHTKVCINVSVE